jgi:hypothetical protein
MSRPSQKALYKAAKKLARQGQPVFPVRATYVDAKRKAKTPLTKNGVKDASLDLDQIKRWWTRHESAAVGIPTGVLWDVLDVDVKREQDGRVHLVSLHQLGLLNGCQKVARTPSGGLHLYFHSAPGMTNKANATLGLDVRALGGYVIAPVSYIDARRDPDGGYKGAYELLCDTTEATDEPLNWALIQSALAPVNTVTKKPVELLGYERRSSLVSLRGWLSERVEGERNNALHWAVCRCIENGIDPKELMEVAVVALGLGEEETEKTIESALRRAGVTSAELYSEAEALFPGSDD